MARRSQRTLAGIAMALACALGAAPAAADQLFERSVRAPAGGTLVVALERGGIDVVSHPNPTLRVEALVRGLGAENVTFQFDRRGDTWVLRSGAAEWLEWLSVPPRVQVRAWVPHHYAVELETRDGAVETHRVDGSVRARTEEGTIFVENAGGPVDLKSAGGRVTAHFADSPRGLVYSEGGVIELSVPTGARVDLDAHSQGGRVVVDHGLGLVPVSRTATGPDRALGPMNGGGAFLHLRGAGGDILLRGH